MDDIVPLRLKLRHTSTSPYFIQNLSVKKRQTFRNNIIADFSDQTCKQKVMILLCTWTPYKTAHCLQGACWQQGISTPYYMFLLHCRQWMPMVFNMMKPLYIALRRPTIKLTEQIHRRHMVKLSWAYMEFRMTHRLGINMRSKRIWLHVCNW